MQSRVVGLLQEVEILQKRMKCVVIGFVMRCNSHNEKCALTLNSTPCAKIQCFQFSFHQRTSFLIAIYSDLTETKLEITRGMNKRIALNSYQYVILILLDVV